MFDFLKKTKKDPNRETYMGLILKENEGEVILLEANSETRIIHPLDQKKFTFTDAWEHLDADVDQTLFELEKRSNLEVEKTVLFVYSHFVDQEKKTIRNPYKGKIKALADELGLTLMGFVEFHEALGIYFHSVEQTPLSAIVIELDGPAVSIFVYKGGKIDHAQTIAHTSDLIGDLERVFTQLKDSSYLPARIILYDSTDLQEISSKLMAHAWDEKLFIQIPKVEVIAAEKLQSALYSCFAKQVFEENLPSSGGSAVRAAGAAGVAGRGIGEDDEEEMATSGVAGAAEAPVILSASEGSQSTDDSTNATEEISEADTEVDAPAKSEESQMGDADDPVFDEDPAERVTSSGGLQESGAAGFVIGKDIAQGAVVQSERFVQSVESAASVSSPTPAVYAVDHSDSEEDFSPQAPKKPFKLPAFSLPQISLNGLNFSFMKSKGVIFAVIALVLLALAGGVFASTYYLHKAQITLLYRTPKITKEITMNDVRTKDQSKTIEVSDNVVATGKKTVGEKAKGSIQIFNVEKAERSLKKGTEVKTDGGIVFTLDSDVKVASASSSTTSGGDVTITTGKQKVAVTAAALGTEGNISKDTKLTFSGISSESLKAAAEGAFTGGTKRDITTVSRDDIEKLDKKVKAAAKNQVKTESSIEQLAVVTLSNEDYSHEVGQEGSEVSIKAQATVTIPQSDEAAIKSEIARKLAGDVEDGYALTKESIQYVVTKASDKGGKVNVTLKVNATPQYVLNRERFLLDVKGKSVQVATDIAKSDYQAADFTIEVDTWIPFLKSRLPFFNKNIQTEVRSM